jgi:hypothetical protein
LYPIIYVERVVADSGPWDWSNKPKPYNDPKSRRITKCPGCNQPLPGAFSPCPRCSTLPGPKVPVNPARDITHLEKHVNDLVTVCESLLKRIQKIEAQLAMKCSCGKPTLEDDYLCGDCRAAL